FSDFSLWVLRVERVRWVGGYGRMDSATAAAYARAEADPVAGHAAGAIAHLNADHADALLVIAQALGGHPDATRPSCTGLARPRPSAAAVSPSRPPPPADGRPRASRSPPS